MKALFACLHFFFSSVFLAPPPNRPNRFQANQRRATPKRFSRSAPVSVPVYHQSDLGTNFKTSSSFFRPAMHSFIRQSFHSRISAQTRSCSLPLSLSLYIYLYIQLCTLFLFFFSLAHALMRVSKDLFNTHFVELNGLACTVTHSAHIFFE